MTVATSDRHRADELLFELNHLSLRVPDYEASLAWYQHNLHLPVIHEWTDQSLPGLRLCHLHFGSTMLEPIGGGTPPARPSVTSVAEHLEPQGVIHLCLTVPDLPAAMRTLRGRGTEPFAGPIYVAALDITVALIQDNSGNVLEIAQRGPLPT